MTNDFALKSNRQMVELFHKYQREYINIPNIRIDDLSPHWLQGWFPPSDAMMLYALVRNENPDLVFEIGSGESTKFIRRAIVDGDLHTKLISMDPEPRSIIDTICDLSLREPFGTDTYETVLKHLTSVNRPILFIDGSHMVEQDGDVTTFFLRILPELHSSKNGAIIHLHDIFLPDDYPAEWKDRKYNEQYLLASTLLADTNEQYIQPLFSTYLGAKSEWWMKNTFKFFEEKDLLAHQTVGGSFWFHT